MEIRRDVPPKRFTPVTLTLNSQEEVDLIFHLANCRTDLPFEKYVENIAHSKTNEGGMRLFGLKIQLFQMASSFYYDGKE